MKYTFCLLTFLYASMVMYAQNIITATYNDGDIPTNCVYCVQDASCFNSLILTLPAGDNYTVTSVDVAYSMTALGTNHWKSHQRSSIAFQNTNTFEAEVYGSGDTPGVQSYARSLAIANGTYQGGTELVFNMNARRLVHTTPGCNDTEQKVNASTWTITVHYSNEVTNPKVGINTSSPSQTMDVAGKIKLADDITAAQAGTVRWNASTNDFEGYDGTRWRSFTKSSSAWGNQPIQDGIEDQKLTAADGAAVDHFGRSVSIHGDYAIVGADEDDIGANSDQGSAYIFKRSGTTWVQDAKLTASDGAYDDSFGRSVSIHGDYAIVGAFGDDIGANNSQGSAYIFKRSGTTWVQKAKLTAADGAYFDFFGQSVSIHGDYAIVGADNAGSAYIFKRSGATWAQEAKLTVSNGAFTKFGNSVSIHGDYAIVGAYEDDIGANNAQGSAYIFKRSGTTWAQEAKLTDVDGADGDRFGNSVSIHGDYAIVGAYTDDYGANSNQGSAIIFHRSGTTWAPEAKLRATDGADGDIFGESVSIHEDYAIVVGQGSAYIFKRSSATWRQETKLTASDGAFFRQSVSIHGDYVIVGAYNDDIGANVWQGSAYIFLKN